MAKTEDMRGLKNFIKEIRACSNKDEEEKRVEKELANIASQYQQPKLKKYNQKKYTWKLLYIYMLGYDVDFGHKQAADLCSAEVFSEKQVGYVACSVLLNENHEFLRLIVNSIQKDIDSRNEAYQSLALSFVGSVGGAEMAESLTDNVIKVLTGGTARNVIKKKAALALLRLLRKTRGDADFLPPESWGIKIAQLLEEKDLGLHLCVVNLLIGIVLRSYVGYENCVPVIVGILKRLVTDSKDVPPEYKYYGVPSPWLQVKALRALQYFPLPSDPIVLKDLKDVLSSIMTQRADTNGDAASTKASGRKNVNLNNAKNGILFEGISYCLGSEIDNDLLMKGVHILGDFLTGNEPNIKYLALENMARLAVVPDLFGAIKEKQAVVLASLKDHDVSIRKRALDLLYKICDSSNAHQILNELLATLPAADQTMKEQMVLKIAILAEKFASSVEWYVDVILRLIRLGGEYISTEIWQRAIQVVTNHDAMQSYAVNSCVESLQNDSTISDALLSVCAFILGEYGQVSELPPQDLFNLLHDKFWFASLLNKSMLLTTFFKLLLLAPENGKLKEDVLRVLRQFSTNQDTEIQQRAVEYIILLENVQQAQKLQLFASMPKWPQRESMLVKRLLQQDAENADNYENVEGTDDATGDGPSIPIPSGHVRQQSDILKFESLEIGSELQNGFQGPPVEQTVQVKTSNVLDDLFGVPVSPTSPTSLQQPLSPDPFAAPVSAANPFADPFSAPQPAAAPAPTPMQVEMVKDLQKCFADLSINNSGVLYEDVHLQIGLKSVYSGNIGQLQLFFGNKQPTLPLTKVNFGLGADIPGLRLQIDSNEIPTELEPQVQKIVPVKAECQNPFVGSPTVKIGYTLQNQFLEKEIRLPIVQSKFLKTFKVTDKSEFYNQWRQAPETNKASEIIDATSPVPVQNVVDGLESIGFSAKDRDLDPNTNNDAGAAYFMYQGGQMFCMVRVEVTPDRLKMKVTVVSPNPQLSYGLKDQIISRIKL